MSSPFHLQSCFSFFPMLFPPSNLICPIAQFRIPPNLLTKNKLIKPNQKLIGKSTQKPKELEIF
jgi:hypothetical protein